MGQVPAPFAPPPQGQGAPVLLVPTEPGSCAQLMCEDDSPDTLLQTASMATRGQHCCFSLNKMVASTPVEEPLWKAKLHAELPVIAGICSAVVLPKAG